MYDSGVGLSYIQVPIVLSSSVPHDKIKIVYPCHIHIQDTACKKPVGGTFKSPRKQISTSRLHPVQCSSPSCSLSHITFCTFLIARPRLILELGIVYAHFDARMELRVCRNSTPAAKMRPVKNY